MVVTYPQGRQAPARPNAAAGTPMLTVSRAQLGPLIQAMGLPRNTLSAVFDLPEGSTAPPGWQNFGQWEQAALQLALPLLASPALVARTRAVFDETRFLATWIVTGSGNEPALTPYLMLAHDEAADTFQLKPVLNRETVARSFLPYLDTGLAVMGGDAFDLPVGAFGLLVALCDLVRRARYSAGLDHSPAPQQFTIHDIELALADGRENGDPRWLLPHLLAIRPDLPALPDPSRWLPVLKSRGWLANGADPVMLSETGQRLAHFLDQRLAMFSFWVVGATKQGELASRSSIFVRCPWHIWCFDVGSEDGVTATGAPVDVGTAYGLLQDLLTPVGAPRPVQAPSPAPGPAPAPSAPEAPSRAGEPLPRDAAHPAPAAARRPDSGTVMRQPAVPQPQLGQLLVIEGSQAGQVFTLGGQATLGRSAECTIRLEDEQASRRHARLSQQGGSWVLEDLGSRNGTLVNGQRIGQAVLLQAGDWVRIGNSLFQISGPGRVEPVASEPSCPHCAQTVSSGARFCRHCGKSIP